jgi:hypothetical protein
MECELLHSGGLVSNVPSVFSGDAYADCKTSLEERGYVRVGTEHYATPPCGDRAIAQAAGCSVPGKNMPWLYQAVYRPIVHIS